MNVIMDLCLVPMGVGVSVSEAADPPKNKYQGDCSDDKLDHPASGVFPHQVEHTVISLIIDEFEKSRKSDGKEKIRFEAPRTLSDGAHSQYAAMDTERSAALKLDFYEAVNHFDLHNICPNIARPAGGYPGVTGTRVLHGIGQANPWRRPRFPSVLNR